MQEVRDHFRTICGDVHVVRGLSDEGDYPEETVLTVGGVRIGLLHGHQCLPWGDVDALGAVQRRLGCEILVSGHTHRQRVYKYENRLLVDPGSATGAFTPGEAASTPSFCLMEVGGEPRGRVVAYCYRLEDGEVKVERIEHTLDLGDAGAVPPVSLVGGEVGGGQAGDGAEAVAKAEAEAETAAEAQAEVAAKAEAQAAAKAEAEAAAKAEAEVAAKAEAEAAAKAEAETAAKAGAEAAAKAKAEAEAAAKAEAEAEAAAKAEAEAAAKAKAEAEAAAKAKAEAAAKAEAEAEAAAKAEVEAKTEAEAAAQAEAEAEAAAKAEAETAANREVETEDPEPEPKSEPEPAGAVPEATDPFAPFAVSPSDPAAASAGPNLLGDLGDPFVQVAQTPPVASAMRDPFAAPEPVSGGGPHEAEPCADPFAASPSFS